MKNQRERKGRKVGKKSVVPSFLTKLYQILENSEYHSIVRWAENGKAFVVKNLPEFIERVLPSYFKHNNFASFVRQLNMYDFHKTRNSQNENTFYHKMFSKGQRNLLKLIKRKVNNSHRRESIESDFSEVQESKVSPKKNLEDIYLGVLQSLDELNQRQREIEIKVDSLEKKNDNISHENEIMSQEVTEKKTYTNNLEMLIILILEYLMREKEDTSANYLLLDKKNENEKNSQNGKNCENFENNLSNDTLTLTSKILEKDPNISLVSLSESLDYEEKTNLLKSFFGEINDDVLKNILEKSITNNNLEETLLSRKLVMKRSLNESGCSIYAENTLNTQRQLEFCETNMSSPTSLMSNTDCIFKGIVKISKFPILTCKRKRTEDSIGMNEFDSGAINLNLKEKDSMFDEMTRLTPCLISSPIMSPSPHKRQESHYRNNQNFKFVEASSNIFTTHKSSHQFTSDSFYGYSLEEKGEASHLINSTNRNLSQ